ncbi:MAG TPA: ferrous iron transport protein B, partial [Sedimenticola sp.]|nr:ferrous iron transport protein B [Sedimenticola sp.]
MNDTPRDVVVALSSIPNTGKSTLFNRLTASRQNTGNWPGVSIERKSGHFDLGEYRIRLVDLPGAYSLSPVTEEERVVREFFLSTPPDAVLNLLDARNLYRGLGLTLQMAMSGLPMVVAVNMIDEARRQGGEPDLEVLSSHLGVPVVAISARTGEGIPALLDALYQTVRNPARARPPHIACPPVLEEAIKDLSRRLEMGQEAGSTPLDPNFIAMRLLEGGEREPLPGQGAALRQATRRWAHQVEQATGEEIPILCAGCRFSAARGLALEATRHNPPLPDRLSERLDRLLLHPWLGLPLFLLIMLLLFQAVYGLGGPLQGWLSDGFDAAAGWARLQPAVAGLPPWLRSFLFDGVWQGLSVVTSFFPIIALFFVFMSLIEDSGYMARAAFLMDRLMHRLGLDGKAFISLLLGYGCNVPAVMGTRILSSRYNRLLT